MGFDGLDLLLSAAVFLIYSTACIICFIFTFSLDIYNKINDRLNTEIFLIEIINPLGRSIDWFDVWAMSNHKIVGPILMLLSLVDLRLGFYVINTL